MAIGGVKNSTRSIIYLIRSPHPCGISERDNRQCKKLNVKKFHSSSLLCKKDYYSVLGVKKNASQEEIRKAYLKLAKQNHPDRAKVAGAKEKLAELAEAYNVLSDEQKRKEYDSFGGTQENFSGFNNAYSNNWSQYSSIDPEELFKQFFDKTQQGQHSGFGDYAESTYGFAPASEVILNITFEEAAKGCNKTASLNVKDTCPKCGGSKCEPGTKKSKCHHCNGTGEETVGMGPFVIRTTCRACKGSKFVINSPCTECGGKGKTIQRKNVNIVVPAGVEDGQTVRIRTGTQEVFVTFRVEKSKIFRREGADIHSDTSISLSQAVLGGIINIKGIHEDLRLKIPAGTNSHEKFKMAGKGIPRSHTYGHGDHYVHIKIEVPKSLTPQQKAIFKALAEMETNINGTVDGLTDTERGGTKKSADGKDHQQKKSDNDNLDESLFHKIKKKLFG